MRSEMSAGAFRNIATRISPVLRGPAITQRANLYTRPAKHELGLGETLVGLGMFALAILGPSGWILANLESYKKKD